MCTVDALLNAARINDVQTVRDLLDADPFLTVASTYDGVGALHTAAAAGHADIVALLLSRGAGVCRFVGYPQTDKYSPTRAPPTAVRH
jgi:ankyrin repeat protein